MSRTRHTRKPRKSATERKRVRDAEAAHRAAVDALVNPPVPAVPVSSTGEPVCPLCQQVHLFGSGSCLR